MTRMLRGQVWEATLDQSVGSKMWVVVSHNPRNRNFDTALAVRVTTTNRHANLPTVIALPAGESIHGWVVCDSLTELWDEDLNQAEPTGALSPRTMNLIAPGLKAALGLPPSS